jgi:hypothetical protein
MQFSLFTAMLCLALAVFLLVESGESAPTTQGTTTKPPGKSPKLKKKFKFKNMFHPGLPIPNILRGKRDGIGNFQFRKKKSN